MKAHRKDGQSVPIGHVDRQCCASTTFDEQVQYSSHDLFLTIIGPRPVQNDLNDLKDLTIWTSSESGLTTAPQLDLDRPRVHCCEDH